MRTRTIVILLTGLVCLALLVLMLPKVVSFLGPKEDIVWSQDFSAVSGADRPQIPENWRFRKKPGTPPAVFSIKRDGKSGGSYLRMEADKASGSLITRIGNIDLRRTPFLKWRWRAEILPEGADGRDTDRDDQAVGIYVGAGSLLSSKSVAYRWDTDTPKGAEGNCAYGGGVIKVKWFTLRNAEDAKSGRWFTEERNVAEDFKNAWGFYPDKIYLSVSCNSQYTGTRAVADLEWIGFISASSGKGASREDEE